MTRKRIADQTHLIATKLRPPKLTARFLARAGWSHVIEQVPQKQVTILNSSVGFGKTTLLVQIYKQLVSLGYRVSWLSLDPDDDQFWRFFDYLLTTLEAQGVDMSLAEQVSEGENPSAARDTVLAAMSHQLVDSPEPLFLILDDFHHLEDENILQLVSRLVSMPPPNFHLVLASRHQPRLPLSRTRAQGALLEISSDDLRLSEDETGSFIELKAGQVLSNPQLRALQEKTEGWVSALQLVAIAIRRRRKVDEYIESFSGSTQTIAEYLADSVFDSLDAQLQQFLVEASILDRLSDDLCHAVTSIPVDQFPLQELHDINLFIEPLDDEQTWFGFHALFRDYLQARLKRSKTIQSEELHKRARDWYASNKLYDLAVRHALSANSVESAVDLVEQCALEVVSQGRYRTLMHWADSLPASEVRQRVRLQMGLAVALCLSHKLDEAARLIGRIEEMKPSTQELGEFANVLPILRALELSYFDRLSDAGELAEAWLSDKENYLTANPVFTISAFNILGYARIHQGKFAEVRETYVPLSFLSKEAIPAYGWMLMQLAIGVSWQMEGKLGKALEYFQATSQETEELLGKRSTTAIQASSSLAEPKYQKGQHDFLFDHIEPHLDVIDETSLPDTILTARLSLACAHVAVGRSKIARDILKKGEAIAVQYSWPRLRIAFQSQRMRIATQLHEWREADLLQAELEKAQEQSDQWQGMPVDEMRYFIGIAIGERLLQEGNFKKAVDCLQELCESLEKRHFTYLGFKVRVPLSIALYSAGQAETALDCFHRTLQLAAEEQLLGIYLEQGSSLAPLLKAYTESRAEAGSEALNTLLTRLNTHFSPEGKAPVGAPAVVAESQPADIENPDQEVRLGSRELEVLKLVAQGLTNKHIARALSIGPETVKWHLKNLFAKLEVRSRVDAVQKARRLEMID